MEESEGYLSLLRTSSLSLDWALELDEAVEL